MINGTETKTGTCAAATPQNFDFDVDGYTRVRLTMTNTGDTNAIGTTKIYVSLDGTNFTELSSMSTLIGSVADGATSKLVDMPVAAKTLRVELTSTSGSTASVTIIGSIEQSDDAVRINGITVTGTNTTGTVVAATLAGSNLTTGRVPIVGTSGLVEDDAGLTYDKSGDAMAVTGTVTATGDIAAAGGFRQTVGPTYVTLAADQTAAAMTLGVSGGAWVAPRAGSVVGLSAMLSAAITGSTKTCTFRVYKNGSLLDANLDALFTTGGAETSKNITAAKDAYAFAAGDLLKVVYTTTTITNTPNAVAFLHVEC